MERGLTVKQIASGRGSGVSYIRDVWNSLLHSLKGTMPGSKSDAKINSQVYKELLNHYLSPVLRTYVNTRLDKLIDQHGPVAYPYPPALCESDAPADTGGRVPDVRVDPRRQCF